MTSQLQKWLNWTVYDDHKTKQLTKAFLKLRKLFLQQVAVEAIWGVMLGFYIFNLWFVYKRETE